MKFFKSNYFKTIAYALILTLFSTIFYSDALVLFEYRNSKYFVECQNNICAGFEVHSAGARTNGIIYRNVEDFNKEQSEESFWTLPDISGFWGRIYTEPNPVSLENGKKYIITGRGDRSELTVTETNEDINKLKREYKLQALKYQVHVYSRSYVVYALLIVVALTAFLITRHARKKKTPLREPS